MTYRISVFVDAEFDGGRWLTWSGQGTVTYDGLDWLGIGDALQITDVSTGPDGEMSGISLSLAGVSPEIIAIAEAEPYQRRPARVLWVFFDANWQPVNHITYASGLCDVMSSDEDPANPTITLTVEPRTLDLQRPSVVRLTPEDRRALYPTETGFDMLQAGVETEFVFGKASAR